VIAIIGILIGMLLPAVQQVRAAARRIQCANNMRQIAIAVHNYESSHRSFPVNQIGPGEDGSGKGGYYSWLVPLLPFVEQNNLYQGFDLSIDNAGNDRNPWQIGETHPNATAAATQVETFLCPSDFPSDDNTIMGTANPAASSYSGSIGWPAPTTGFGGERKPNTFSGIIPLERPEDPVGWHGSSRFGFESVTDGTSNTAMISERLIQTATTSDEVRANSRITAGHITPERAEPLRLMTARFESSGDSNPHVPERAHIGRSWSSGYPLAAPTYSHFRTPNKELGFYCKSKDDGDFLATAGSEHIGGVNLVRVDGSVSFVGDNVDQEVWWALGSRNDGRVQTLDN